MAAATIVAVAAANAPVQKSVVVFARVTESLGSLAFLVHEAKDNAWFFPCGKIETTDGSKHAAANREVREEIGMKLPDNSPLLEYKTYVFQKDGDVIGECTAFLVDVSITHLHAADPTFRGKVDAHNLAEELRRKQAAGEDPSLQHGFLQCPVTEEPIAEYYDFATRRDHTSFSFGHLIPVEELKSVLDFDAVDGQELGGFPLRYSMEESPLWAEALKIYADPRSAKDIYKVTAQFDTAAGAEDAAAGLGGLSISPEFLRQLPKFPIINSVDDRNLNHQLIAVKNRIQLMGMDLDTTDAVKYVVTMFDDTLNRWWNGQGKGLNIASIDDLIHQIRKGFSVKDFEGESLIQLLALSEGAGNNSVAKFTSKFNEYYADWENEMSFKLDAYLYIRGLASENIRSDLMIAVQTDSFKDISDGNKLNELQTRAANAVLARNDLMKSGGFARGSTSSNSAPDRKRKEPEASGSKKNNGGWKKNNGKGGKNGNGKKAFTKNNKPPNSAAFEAGKAKLSKEQLKEAFNQGKCIKCMQKGHLFENCPN